MNQIVKEEYMSFKKKYDDIEIRIKHTNRYTNKATYDYYNNELDRVAGIVAMYESLLFFNK